MTTRLFEASGSELCNVFQVIGGNEDALTRGIAWVLRACPDFLAAFVQQVLRR